MTLLVIMLAVSAAALLLYWLLVASEGVYLGQRVVIALYDLTAGRYDRIKEFDDDGDLLYIVDPLLRGIAPQNDPLLLDAATGTARLPLLLCRQPEFEGHIVALDLSRQMLRIAADKLDACADNVTLVQHPIETLPFPGSLFDVVTCLEALEFTPQPAQTLRELVRVLRPGGLLVITNRFNTRWLPGKLWSDAALQTLLVEYGMTDIVIDLWQADYKRVFARKTGQSDPTGAIPLDGVLLCPVCGGGMEQIAGQWACRACDAAARTSADGVIALVDVQGF